MSLEEKATDAWAVYEYREHPKGLYHTCFVDGYQQGYEQAEKDLANVAQFSSGLDGFFYGKGYQQAEKDTIERAVTWLKDNANKYIVDLTPTYPDAPVNLKVGGMCWEDLTKYLKDNE